MYSPTESAAAERAAVRLHARAKNGHQDARQELLVWAYRKATRYYQRKTARERLLTRRDAEDLVAMFCLEFERAWPRVNSLLHYTRRMLRNNLSRYLSRKRRRSDREISLPAELLCEKSDARGGENLVAESHRVDDATWIKLRVVDEVMSSADEVTRAVLVRRTMDPPMPYRVIAAELGGTETAMRMRAARFYQVVRTVHERAHSRMAHSDASVTPGRQADSIPTVD